MSIVKGRDSVSQLYRAVERYVKSKGGFVTVIGPIALETWPGDGPHSFTIGVKCTGKTPQMSTKKASGK